MRYGGNIQRICGISVLFVLLWLVGLPAAAVCEPESSAGAATATQGDWNLTLFHTNDMHGAFLPEPASWREDRAEVGGMIALAWHLAQQRHIAAPDLLLDAGDFMTGNPICQIEVNGVKGAGFVEMMNAVGYEASVIGNHEFDNGRANSLALTTVASFPLLAADVLDEGGDPAYAHEPLVLTRGELTIGVMGVTCAGLFEVTAADHTAGLSLRNQARVVREMITALDPVTDLLVLITHNGFDDDRELARELTDSGLDVIVGGHSHTRLEEPVVEGGIIIVQAGSHLKNLGRLDLRVVDDQVVAHAGRLIQLTAAGTSAGEELTALVDSYQQEVNEVFGQVIGTLATEWRRNGGESNVGNWLTDRVRERTDTEVAFLNSGTIRKNLAAGPVRLLDIHELLPFTNTLVTFDLTGEEILTLLTTNASAQAYGRHGILQVSGLRYGFRQVGDHVEVEQVTVGGQPLVRNQVYRVAAPDYVVMKAERYFGFPVSEFTPVGAYLTDTIVAAVTAADTVYAETDGRIRDLTGVGESK